MSTVTTGVIVDKVLVTYHDENGEHTLDVNPTEVHAIAWTDNAIARRDANPPHTQPTVPERKSEVETQQQATARSFCWYDGRQWHC
jgi:hypothetical protein